MWKSWYDIENKFTIFRDKYEKKTKSMYIFLCTTKSCFKNWNFEQKLVKHVCMDGNAYRIYIMTHIFRKDTSTTCNRLMVESNHCFIDMKHITDSAMFHVLQQFLKLQTYSFQFPRYSFARLAGSYAGPSYKQVWLWIWIIKNQAFY